MERWLDLFYLHCLGGEPEQDKSADLGRASQKGVLPDLHFLQDLQAKAVALNFSAAGLGER